MGRLGVSRATKKFQQDSGQGDFRGEWGGTHKLLSISSVQGTALNTGGSKKHLLGRLLSRCAQPTCGKGTGQELRTRGWGRASSLGAYL